MHLIPTFTEETEVISHTHSYKELITHVVDCNAVRSYKGFKF